MAIDVGVGDYCVVKGLVILWYLGYLLLARWRGGGGDGGGVYAVDVANPIPPKNAFLDALESCFI